MLQGECQSIHKSWTSGSCSKAACALSCCGLRRSTGQADAASVVARLRLHLVHRSVIPRTYLQCAWVSLSTEGSLSGIRSPPSSASPVLRLKQHHKGVTQKLCSVHFFSRHPVALVENAKTHKERTWADTLLVDQARAPPYLARGMGRAPKKEQSRSGRGSYRELADAGASSKAAYATAGTRMNVAGQI